MRLRGWDGEDLDIAHPPASPRVFAAAGQARAATVLHLWHPYREAARAVDRRLESTRRVAPRTVEAFASSRELAAQVTANRVRASSSSGDPVKR